jgi:hypothetical protein
MAQPLAEPSTQKGLIIFSFSAFIAQVKIC